MPLRLLALSLQTAISPACASQSKLLDRQIAACGAGGEHAAALVINPYQDDPAMMRVPLRLWAPDGHAPQLCEQC
jgi:hypothetical protein